MSLINDALKQARKAPPRDLPASVPPRNQPSAAPPWRPAADDSAPAPAWLFPALGILLMVAAIFFTGWAMAHHNNLRAIATAPEPPTAAPAAPAISVPVVQPQTVQTPPPLHPPAAPKLQGIVYSSTAPSAIVNGQTVRPGDTLGEYQVKAISKFTVTLVGPDHKELQIGMGN